MTEENNQRIRNLSSRDYATCAMVLAHEARRWLAEGDLQRAEECLTVQQRMLIGAGSKDIGKLTGVRNLPENVFKERIAKQRKIDELYDEINDLQQQIERLKADLEPPTIRERIINIFK